MITIFLPLVFLAGLIWYVLSGTTDKRCRAVGVCISAAAVIGLGLYLHGIVGFGIESGIVSIFEKVGIRI